MVKILTVTSPVYARSDRLSINCIVTFDDPKLPGPHNYTSAAHDPEWHGQKLWLALTEGVYGPVAPYPGVSPAEAERLLKLRAALLLSKTDVTITRCYEKGVPVPAAWSTYRDALRDIISLGAGDIPEQPGYPEGT